MAGSDVLLERIGADARHLCKRTWWVFLIGGLATLAFGLLSFAQPGIALFVLASFFAASILVDGAFNLVGALRNRDKDGWWIMLLMGALGLLVGGYALWNPPISMLALVLIVAVEAIALGIFLILLGYRVRLATTREWLLYLTGALSIVFGVLVALRPAVGGLTVVFVIASWAVVIGVLKIVLAFKVRALPDAIESAGLPVSRARGAAR